MGGIRTHKDLDVWKESMNLAIGIYSLTRDFPREETHGLAAQMRRAAVSVPSNIAEGAARNSQRDFIRFLYISLGSLAELETQLLLSRELGFTKSSKVSQTGERIDSIRRMLIGLIKSLEKRSR
jgi:four helix bundle protein